MRHIVKRSPSPAVSVVPDRARPRLRPVRTAIACLAAYGVVSAAAVGAGTASAAARPAGPGLAATPRSSEYLDQVEAALNQVSPGLRGTIWERTEGNSLDLTDARWLLQVPDCWGQNPCPDKPGIANLLGRMTSHIAKATKSVDISTLLGDPRTYGWPDGAFNDAIEAGLRAAVAAGHHLKVRILAGTAPGLGLANGPQAYLDKLRKDLGSAADSIDFAIASMLTFRNSAGIGLSWNHSKLIVVDGLSAITGGINDYKDNYIDTGHPVTDIDMTLHGPASTSAANYLDALWTWSCANVGTGLTAKVWLATSRQSPCMTSLPRDTPPATGDVPVIAVGGLGLGIMKKDPDSRYQLPPVWKPSAADCGLALWGDYTNSDRDYATVNPDQEALRALVGSAKRSVVLSQQDLNGLCAWTPVPSWMPKFDIRLFDTIAAKLYAGVKVRILISTPNNEDHYSNISSITELSDPLRDRLTHLTGDKNRSEQIMRDNLQLASLRSSTAAKWADGATYAMHTKLVSVDDSAFYIGSKNLYPAWIQDHGFIVGDPTAALQLKEKFLDPEWKYSCADATYNYASSCP